MLFAVVIGALIFSDFINRAGLPDMLLNFVTSMDVAPIVVIFAIMGIYVVLGMVFESLSMMLLTVPVFYPVVASLGYDLVWFGIILAMNLQTSFLTPPFGFSLFYLKGVCPPEVRTVDLYRGVIPFIIIQVMVLISIVVFPGFYGFA